MYQISRILQRNSVGSVTHLITDYWFLITPLILSGCMGVYEGGFECPPGKGMGCKSISEVNQMVNQCSVPGIQYPESGTVSSPSEHRTLNTEHCSIPGIQYPEELKLSSDNERLSSCQQNYPDSCFLTSDSCIWYSPFFENEQKEKQGRCLHASDSI